MFLLKKSKIIEKIFFNIFEKSLRNQCESVFKLFPKKRAAVKGSFSVTAPGHLVGRSLPETASDKKQSVLVRVFWKVLFTNESDEHFSRKSSMLFTSPQNDEEEQQQERQQQQPQQEKQEEQQEEQEEQQQGQQPREGRKSSLGPASSRNSLADTTRTTAPRRL